MSVLDEPLQNLVEGKTLQEVVLLLFQHRTNAGTIMSLCHLTEDQLEEFIPRSMWAGHINTPCRSCRGRGYHSKEVPWEQDQVNRRDAVCEVDITNAPGLKAALAEH